jgi:hypothetical protein
VMLHGLRERPLAFCVRARCSRGGGYRSQRSTWGGRG